MDHPTHERRCPPSTRDALIPMSTRIWIRRAYEPPSPVDDHRVLVDRLWPRGISKTQLRIDTWARHVAPARPESAAMQSKSSHDGGDVGWRVPPVGRCESTAMTTGHRDREEDRLVARIAGALETVHLVHIDALRSSPAGTAVTAQPAIGDRELLGPTGIVLLSHPRDKRVHRRSHTPTLRVAPPS